MQSRITSPEAVREVQADRSRAHFLVVEDGPGVQSVLQRIFADPGHSATTFTSVPVELEAFCNVKLAVVKLHLIRTDRIGHRIYVSTATGQPDVLAIVVARVSEVLKKVTPQELRPGAYASGHLAPPELASQFGRSLLREQNPATPVGAYIFGQCEIDFAKMTARRASKVVGLTILDFRLLGYFLNNPERVLSRQELLGEVWGYNCYPTTRTVDNHILKLRQKLEPNPTEPRYFQTVHGAGYKFVP